MTFVELNSPAQRDENRQGATVARMKGFAQRIRGWAAYSLVTATAICSTLTGEASAPVTWEITGPGTTAATVPSPGTQRLTYSMSGSAVFNRQTWTVSTTVPADGDYEFSWNYSGYHAFFMTNAFLKAFGPGIDTTLVADQPVGGGFNFNANGPTFTFTNLHAGDVIGFTMGGSNFDSDSRLIGTLDIRRTVQDVIYQKGDAVPEAGGATGIPADATFTSFGTPAINESGTIAVLGRWTSPEGIGAGIFVGGELVAKLGDLVTGDAFITSMKDPVINEAGKVTFGAALEGTSITPQNNVVILSNAPFGAVSIIAQEGTPAPGAPLGALWKSFQSTALPNGGGGSLILATLGVGTGGVTAANDLGLWATDNTGTLRLIVQEGTTKFGGKTVRSFSVLKTVSGSSGQTHSFNSSKEVVLKVVFEGGAQAIVLQGLP